MSKHFHGRNFRQLRAKSVSGNQALELGVKFSIWDQYSLGGAKAHQVAQK